MANSPRDFFFFERGPRGELRLAATGRPARVIAAVVAIIVAAILATAALPIIERLLLLVMNFP